MTNTDNSKAPVKHCLDIVKPKKVMGLPHKPHIKSRTPMEGLVAEHPSKILVLLCLYWIISIVVAVLGDAV